MNAFVALLRGVNVGGRMLKMALLKETCEAQDWQDVRTYLQSGNVVFRAKGTAARLAQTLEQRLVARGGPEVRVLVLGAEEWDRVVRENPLVGAPGLDERFLHVTLLLGKPRVEISALKLPKSGEERVAEADGRIYLYCPHGYGTTKLSNACFERALKAPATTRNWRTVMALREMMEE